MKQQFWMALREWDTELVMDFHSDKHSVYRHRTRKTVLVLDPVLLVAIDLLQLVITGAMSLQRPREESVDTECDGKRLPTEPKQSCTRVGNCVSPEVGESATLVDLYRDNPAPEFRPTLLSVTAGVISKEVSHTVNLRFAVAEIVAVAVPGH